MDSCRHCSGWDTKAKTSAAQHSTAQCIRHSDIEQHKGSSNCSRLLQQQQTLYSPEQIWLVSCLHLQMYVSIYSYTLQQQQTLTAAAAANSCCSMLTCQHCLPRLYVYSCMAYRYRYIAISYQLCYLGTHTYIGAVLHSPGSPKTTPTPPTHTYAVTRKK